MASQGRGALSEAPWAPIYWRPRKGAGPRVKLPIPKGVERRLRPYMRRGEQRLRDWEWTWTRAFLAGIVISFFALLTLAVAPSWWLYFAEQELEWTSC
jgi:hypothetical protein